MRPNRYIPGLFWVFCCLFILNGELRAKAISHSVDSLIQICQHNHEDTNKVKLLVEISNAIDCSDTANKILYANNALELSDKLNWVKGRIEAHNSIGNILANCLHDYNRSNIYYEKGLALAKEINDKSQQVVLLGATAENYRKLNEYGKAIDYYQKALNMEYNDENKVAILGNMGYAYSDIGDYSRALDCFQKALAIEEVSIRQPGKVEQNDSATYGLLLVTIGDIYTSMSQYKMALSNYDSALRINANLKVPLLQLLINGSVGKMYRRENEYSKAIEYYQQALLNSTDLGNKTSEAEFLNELGNIYLETGDVAKAMDYAQQSLDIAMLLKGNKQLCETYITLGKIYIAKKTFDKAISYLKDAFSISEKIGLLEQESEALLYISKAYEQVQQPKLALEAYQMYITARDSVYSQEKAKEIIRMEMQSDFDKQKLADRLKQNIARNALNLKLQKQQILTYSGFGGLILLVLLSVLIFRNYSHEKKANAIIQYEKEKSDELLLNILPSEVAEELKAKGSVQAHQYENITVMFTDFVNFTAAGERLGAEQLVNELDACFVAFDQIIAQYNIEKIKTVGDAYLAVSGLPVPNEKHAEDIIKAAVEIKNYMIKRGRELGEKTFEVRIGIHSGPVVAGIVGVKKFAYDIWGDTVNIAARMEQSGMPGKINISEATHELIKDKFSFNYRGEIDAKNKGKMKMYFVN